MAYAILYPAFYECYVKIAICGVMFIFYLFLGERRIVHANRLFGFSFYDWDQDIFSMRELRGWKVHFWPERYTPMGRMYRYEYARLEYRDAGRHRYAN